MPSYNSYSNNYIDLRQNDFIISFYLDGWNNFQKAFHNVPTYSETGDMYEIIPPGQWLYSLFDRLKPSNPEPVGFQCKHLIVCIALWIPIVNIVAYYAVRFFASHRIEPLAADLDRAWKSTRAATSGSSGHQTEITAEHGAIHLPFTLQEPSSSQDQFSPETYVGQILPYRINTKGAPEVLLQGSQPDKHHKMTKWRTFGRTTVPDATSEMDSAIQSATLDSPELSFLVEDSLYPMPLNAFKDRGLYLVQVDLSFTVTSKPTAWVTLDQLLEAACENKPIKINGKFVSLDYVFRQELANKQALNTFKDCFPNLKLPALQTQEIISSNSHPDRGMSQGSLYTPFSWFETFSRV